MEERDKLLEQLADDYSAVLKEAKSIGCNEIKALYNIPLKNMEMIVQSLEKQIPVKPYKISKSDENDNAEVKCPVCCASNDYAIHSIKQGYCWKCGQRLDWSDKNEID